MKRTIALPLLALSLTAAACSSSPGDSPDAGPDDTSDGTGPDTTDASWTTGGGRPLGFAPAALQQFDDCSGFLDHVHTEGAERVGPYGFGDGQFYGPMIDMPMAVDDAEMAAEESVGGAAPSASGGDADGRATAAVPDSGSGTDGTFSTTNVQVEGVDEPDIVKTDGDRILAVTGETLHYVEVAADGTTGTKRGSVPLVDQDAGWSYGHEIFLSGDRAYVFAQAEQYVDAPIVYEDDVVPEGGGDVAVTEEVEPASGFAAPIDPVEPGRPFPGAYAGPTTLIVEVDLSNPDDLRVVSSMKVEGRYVSARSIGDTARVVVTSPPQDLGFLYPSSPDTEERATEANRQVVLDSTVEDWLPNYELTSGGATSIGQLVECGNVHAPSDFSGFDMLSIVTLDLGNGLGAPTGTSTVMAAGDTVYASQDRLYVSTNVWEPVIDDVTREWLDENYETAFHRFSIAGPGPASYEASGSVEGHLINQFAMNDRDGVFYAATTKGAPWSESTESQIVALEVDGDRLVQVGQVGGLGIGERIYSVRYVGTTAYVVTFRQIDPFYVVDLTDPRAMAVQGELKIPGFSSYLHPISPTLVLGVGQDATTEGRTTGTKVSLFDVSNPAAPVETSTWTLPDAYSDAEFDHRAFLYWEPTGTVVLPLQSYADRFAGAVVLNITPTGIIEQGRITHADEAEGPIGQTDCRVLTLDDLGAAGASESEARWIVQEGGQVQACGEGQSGATGLYCDRIVPEDLQYYVSGEDLAIDLSGVDGIEICWPDWNGWQIAVQRTMVIDDTLWTLSIDRLQANDLGTLERTAAVAL